MNTRLIGQRVRQVRLESGMRQTELARQLGISAAYLNLLEKGRRSIQLPLLLRALEALEQDVETFMASVGEGRADDVLARLLDDPLARTLDLEEADLAALRAEPRLSSTVAALYHLYKNTRAELDRARSRLETLPIAVPLGYAPGDEVTDFLELHGNYFPELEELASAVRRDAQLPRRFVSEQLIQFLSRRHKIDVRVEPPPPRATSSVVRAFDRAHRRLRLSASLAEHALKFQLGHVLGLMLLDDNRLHERLVAGAPTHHAETARLIKIHLANYFAGAVLLPYDEFHAEVERTRYDVEKVAAAFESSYEAVAHRMCNLGDPRRQGVPLHFLRVDVAGNISKRYSASGLRFPHGHGTCPKWAAHAAFVTPAVISKQFSRMPDGATYFCFAKVISDPAAGSLVRGTLYSIGLGTTAENAHRFAYADDLPPPEGGRAVVPAGITCRFCERTDCNQRAAPSYKFAFAIDEYVKKDNFFSPLMAGEEKPDRHS
ncbi:MAG TPA: short-chain fatty acyl-CoA regulator family protein [Candidatus Acidoferrum sp.]|nr:short-chain fatty acyl-CoA regulator family protein [Candidatus Acidoferrum sp.]